MSYCDSCGVTIELTALAPVERSSGCRLWLCWPCQDRAYGASERNAFVGNGTLRRGLLDLAGDLAQVRRVPLVELQ